MLRAVKTKLVSYLNPILEEKKSEETSETSLIDSNKRKRHISQVESLDTRPIKRNKLFHRSPLKLFDGFNWSRIFDRASESRFNMAQAESFVQNSSSFSETSNEVETSSRKILTASRNRISRVPFAQISNTTVLDLTDDNENDAGELDVNVTLDLTKPLESSVHTEEVSNAEDILKLTADIPSSRREDENKKHISRKLPSLDLIGPLNRKKETGLLDETVRLDERMRYKTLLAHYTNVHLPEYSKSISPPTQSADIDTVTTLSSSSSWFSKKYESKPISVDLTHVSTILKPSLTPNTTRRRFFHEILQSKSTSFLQHSSNFDSSSSSIFSQNTAVLPNISDTLKTQTPDKEITGKADASTLLDTNWIQKWRDTIDPIRLEREKRIAEEEKRRDAIKRKQKEEFEELQKKVQESAKVSEFIVLTDDMLHQIKRALGPGNGRDIMVDGFNAEITRSDIATLRNSTWLNDEVINFYFNMLKERSETVENLPRVHVFNTFFYPKIMKLGHAGVKRWTRKIDIFSFALILIPVHLGMHWCLAVVDFKKKQIVYYDSLKGNNPQCIVALRQYLSDESKDKKKTEFNFDGWTEAMPKDIPEQMNGCDCGVFACKYAEYRSRESKFTFTQQNMPYFRKRMVYEICNKKLL